MSIWDEALFPVVQFVHLKEICAGKEERKITAARPQRPPHRLFHSGNEKKKMKRNKRERESIRGERAHKKRERKCFHKKREISPLEEKMDWGNNCNGGFEPFLKLSPAAAPSLAHNLLEWSAASRLWWLSGEEISNFSLSLFLFLSLS